MANRKVQKKLYTEHKEPDKVLEIAIALEEGMRRQKVNGSQAPESVKTTIKSKPSFAVEKTKPRESYRRGEANLTIEHVIFCMATNHRCKLCERIGHVEK